MFCQRRLQMQTSLHRGWLHYTIFTDKFLIAWGSLAGACVAINVKVSLQEKFPDLSPEVSN